VAYQITHIHKLVALHIAMTTGSFKGIGTGCMLTRNMHFCLPYMCRGIGIGQELLKYWMGSKGCGKENLVEMCRNVRSISSLKFAQSQVTYRWLDTALPVLLS